MLSNRTATLGLAITGTGLAALLALSHTLADAVTGTFSAMLPSLQARLELSEATLAQLVAALSMSTSLAQPLFGALADRVGGRLVSLLGLLLSVTLLGLIAIAPRVEVLFLLLVAGGLGSAAFHPATASLVRSMIPEHGALAVGIFSAAGTAGMALGPLVVLSLVTQRGLGAAPWIMLPGLVLGVVLMALVPMQPRVAPTVRASGPRLAPSLLTGRVGLFCLTGILSTLAYITFSHAMPLWLVQAHGLAPNSAVIGWTLAAFSLAAAAGGIAAGLLSRRIATRHLIVAALTLAPLPLWGVLALAPGSPAYYLMVAAAGALVNAGLPLLIIEAQDAAPQAVGMVSGVLMGFTAGLAGLLYIGIGALQAAWGLERSMALAYVALLPAAGLAWHALRGAAAREAERGPVDLASCLCSPSVEPNAAAFPRRADGQG